MLLIRFEKAVSTSFGNTTHIVASVEFIAIFRCNYCLFTRQFSVK